MERAGGAVDRVTGPRGGEKQGDATGVIFVDSVSSPVSSRVSSPDSAPSGILLAE